MSQRPKWPELIWSFLSIKHHIAHSPLDGTLVNHRVTPQQYNVCCCYPFIHLVEERQSEEKLLV